MAVSYRTVTVTNTSTDVDLGASFEVGSYVAVAIAEGSTIAVDLKWSPDGGIAKNKLEGLTGLVAGRQVKIEWPFTNLYARGVSGSGTTTIYITEQRIGR